MARDDDDAVSEEPMRRKDRDDDDADLPRKKGSRDDEADDDRPRKKKARDGDEDRGGKEAKPMPVRLVGAIIASMAWGGYVLHHNCGLSSSALIGIIHMEKRDRGRDFGFVLNQAFGFGEHKGFIYTMAGAEFFMLVMGAVLLAGGVMLLMRMGLGKYLAMGAPAAMALIDLITFVICLAITSGAFLTTYNAGFAINIIFSLAVGGCNAYLLLNKDVSKALK
jgi:hypothetical protein